MDLELTKLISAFLYPLGMATCILLMAILCNFLGWRRLYQVSLTSSITVVLFFSLPFVAKTIVGNLESQYQVTTMKDIDAHDAIVVLGGGLRIPTPPANRVQLGSTSDRYLYAAELYNEGKAPKILLVGGNFRQQNGLLGEAYYAKELLTRWGVNPRDILIDQESRNTEQNKNNASEILKQNGLHTIILVTSALHMPRAMVLFRNTGLVITSGVADQRVRTSETAPWQRYIPSIHALELNTAAIHEYYGLLFLKVRKYIGK